LAQKDSPMSRREERIQGCLFENAFLIFAKANTKTERKKGEEVKGSDGRRSGKCREIGAEKAT